MSGSMVTRSPSTCSPKPFGAASMQLSSSNSLISQTQSTSDDEKYVHHRHLVLSEIPQKIKDVQYAVRGAPVLRAIEIQKQMAENPDAFPFSKLVYCNIGNPHEMGQKPLSFIRQVISIIENPSLIKKTVKVDPGFPDDVRKRAYKYLEILRSSGAYTHSQGALGFRKLISKFLQDRDGHVCDPDSIFMSDGASTAVRMLLSVLIDNKTDGILLPNPQYPLYSAACSALNGTAVEYFLEEARGWGLNMENLYRALKGARQKGINVKAMVVINPGNPSGSLLSEDDLQRIVTFCEDENLVLIADEVYQENIWAENRSWVSMRKTIMDRKSPVQVASLHSASKGFYGECGHRAGFMQFENVDKETLAVLYKMASISLCPNTIGQVVITSVCCPPVPGESSHKLFAAERDYVLSDLKLKAKLVADKLNEIPGFSCQPIDGALYAFPSFTIPEKAVLKATELGQAPDLFYVLSLIQKTGLVTVPGTGFGSAQGDRHHLRMTILPDLKTLSDALAAMKQFHEDFLAEYS